MEANLTLYFITSIITVFITNFIYYDFLKNRYEPKLKTIYYIFYLVLATALVVGINQYENVLLNYLVNISQFMILSIFFKFNSKKDIVVNITFLIFLALLDIISFFIIDTTISILGANFDRNTWHIMIEMVLESLVFFIAYSFIKSFLLKKNYINLKSKDVLIYVSVSIFSWLLCFGLAVFSIYYQEKSFYLFSFFVTIIILLFNVVFVSLEEAVSKKYELENEIKEINRKAEFDVEYYKRLEEKESKNALLFHDIGNHLQILQNMIENKEVGPSVNNYFHKINRVLELNNKKFFSDNKVLEMLINDKIEVADNLGIKVSVKYDNTDISFLSEFDLVTILANMFDNAIDATSDEKIEEKYIDLLIKKIHSYLLIKMTNPHRNEIVSVNNVLKTTKKNHSGLGLKSIRTALEKYNATCKVSTDNEDIFEITVIFPL